MPCKHFKDALITTAATGAHPEGELRAHLTTCADCRAVFTADVALFSSIDSGLRTIASADVPPALLPRVRARLAEEASPRYRWIHLGLTGAAAAALIVGLLLLRGGRPEVNSRLPVTSSPIAVSTPTSQQTIAQNDGPSKLRISRVARSNGIVEAVKSVHSTEDQTVLVSSEQQQAMALLIAVTRRGEMQKDLLAAIGRKDEPDLREIAPLEIAPIGIPPLGGPSEELR